MSYGFDEKGLRKFVMRPFSWLKQHYPELAGWLSETSSYLSAQALCEIKDYGDCVLVNLFTDQRVYHINACAGAEGYLGLQDALRSTGAGNDWTNGPYSKETWHKIVCDMLSCELISLARRDNPTHED
ncbi:hypothetical protein [Duganella vulcania]|uniref:Uncharacterized protein n=1 Tax=Duganella vulcania TaxID=2692166 RepID=A0A845GFC5_9BURK|nr:hypothetical protein [Duganella vulcania]MYM92641.1 hypothetical protein [Duganella vulcania]